VRREKTFEIVLTAERFVNEKNERQPMTFSFYAQDPRDPASQEAFVCEDLLEVLQAFLNRLV